MPCYRDMKATHNKVCNAFAFTASQVVHCASTQGLLQECHVNMQVILNMS